MKRFNPSEIEPKWQAVWADDKRYQVTEDSSRRKYYVSGMFPYPSAAGMHVGHSFEHAIVDAVARFQRANGANVLNPMGWDAFGLPAENYAIKTGTPPAESTVANIAGFTNQLKRLGASIDWSREINTSSPDYYKWTQWVFAQLFERGLAYQKQANQWWCPTDMTVLANEQVEGGKCWRCGSEVVKKSMKQWFFKITDYADALLDEIPALDWPEKIKSAQTNWIGRSEGAEIEFALDLPAADSLKFTPELTQMILDGEKTSTIRLDPKNLQVGDIAEFLTRDGSEVSSFGHAKISNIRTMSLGDIPNDLVGHEVLRDDQDKLERYRSYYGDAVTLETEFTIYDFEFIPNITVFTTRPDTIFGATFLVVAPEHSLVKTLVGDEARDSVEAYVSDALKRSEIERMAEGKEKTGIPTGAYVINPATGEKIPIWVADYVLWGYGTGAIMAVPAHDERDFEFATKFGLPITQVVAPLFVDTDTPPRDGLEMYRRQAIQLIVKHPSDEKYLLFRKLKWKTESYSFVNGGVDEGEDPIDAAAREMAEEAGFSDYEPIREVVDSYFATFYHEFKEQNVTAQMFTFATTLRSLSQDEVSNEERSINELMWVSPEELLQKVQGEGARMAFRDYLKGDRTLRYEGILMNSGRFDGMRSEEAREEIVAWLERQGVGRAKVTYKMRDWLVSRQRYWGAPIPIVHCEKDGAVAVPEADLPVLLPEVEDFVPKGQSVLASVEDWVNTTCPKCGGPAQRETDTMDGYACSSWYLLRYTDPHNDAAAWDPKNAQYWTPLDMYVGGDHAVAHLLYVRFWNHVFYDMGLVPSKEPVKKLVYHGLIGAEDGRKMSKSLGNVIDPLEIIDQGYGADALRTFELFLGPIDENSQWSSRGIAGVYRFLNRAWTLTQEYIESRGGETNRSAPNRTASLPESSGASAPVDSGAADVAHVSPPDSPANLELEALRHRTVKKVTTDIHRLSFNTAIAALMEYVNELYKLKTSGYSPEWRQPIETLAQLLAVFAPHMSAEMWQQLGHDEQLDFVEWPTWDDVLTIAETMTIVVQVNGKVRAKLDVVKDATEDDIKSQALAEEGVIRHLGEKEPTKVIYIPGRLVSIVF